MTAIASRTRPAMGPAYGQREQLQPTGNPVFLVSGLSEWQVTALKKLARLGSLKANWDSYGSPPVSDRVLDLAAHLISMATFEYAPTPTVVALKGGGVQLGWESGGRELEVEVRPDLTIELLAAEDDGLISEFPMRHLDPASLENLLSWLESR